MNERRLSMLREIARLTRAEQAYKGDWGEAISLTALYELGLIVALGTTRKGIEFDTWQATSKGFELLSPTS